MVKDQKRVLDKKRPTGRSGCRAVKREKRQRRLLIGTGQRETTGDAPP